jgi:release factor glutamine methyltransferase
MCNIQQAFFLLREQLIPIYETGEATAIAHEVMAFLTGKNKLQRLMDKEQPLTGQQMEAWEKYTQELLLMRPVQYVLGTAWFRNRAYSVHEQVLIPRPETEELVSWILADWPPQAAPEILDIGTGSGCISISLQLALPLAVITGCDISQEALQTAIANSKALNAGQIHFVALDFLNVAAADKLGQYDVIVSNPPYIPISEWASIDRHVRDYEPAQALFVPAQDPQCFYRAIAAFGWKHLKKGGALYCEVHKDYATESRDLFVQAGYTSTELRPDMRGNNRMLRCRRKS